MQKKIRAKFDSCNFSANLCTKFNSIISIWNWITIQNTCLPVELYSLLCPSFHPSARPSVIYMYLSASIATRILSMAKPAKIVKKSDTFLSICIATIHYFKKRLLFILQAKKKVTNLTLKSQNPDVLKAFFHVKRHKTMGSL